MCRCCSQLHLYTKIDILLPPVFQKPSGWCYPHLQSRRTFGCTNNFLGHWLRWQKLWRIQLQNMNSKSSKRFYFVFDKESPTEISSFSSFVQVHAVQLTSSLKCQSLIIAWQTYFPTWHSFWHSSDDETGKWKFTGVVSFQEVFSWTHLIKYG